MRTCYIQHLNKSSMASLHFIFVLLLSLSFSQAVRQELQIFTKEDAQGSSVTFNSKEGDLDKYRGFLDNAKSFCLVGWWYFYGDKNFEPFIYTTGGALYNRTCENRIFSDVNSFRYVGPLDTETVSISIYNRTSSGAHGGREVLLVGSGENQRFNNLGFHPTGVLLSGNSSWTLHQHNNFTGKSVCYSGSEEMIYFTLEEDFEAISRASEGCQSSQAPI